MKQKIVSREEFRKMLSKSGNGGRRRHTPGQMNRAEARHAAHLDALKAMGKIYWWGFERIKLKLADRTYLTVDFAVIKSDGSLEFQEVKGHAEDDFSVKWKVAKEQFPFEFVLIRDANGRHRQRP